MIVASLWLPPDISTHGENIDSLMRIIHYFMALLFVGWGVFFVYCLLKFKARSGQTARYEYIKAKPSKAAELIVIVIEAVLLIMFSIPVWAAYRNEPPTPDENPLEVHVVAQQFAWNMHYPGPDGKFGARRPELVDEATNPIGLDDSDPAAADDVTTINQFYMCKDRPVIVRLTSKDVIHSFSVPMLRVKQDSVPGMEIPIWFTATQTNDEVREQLAVTKALPQSSDEGTVDGFLRRKKGMIAMADAGAAIKKGDLLTPTNIAAAIDAGVKEIQFAPADPINIQCAQLCGLGHYRMMGQMQILECDAFDEWYASAGEEEEFFDDEEFDN